MKHSLECSSRVFEMLKQSGTLRSQIFRTHFVTEIACSFDIKNRHQCTLRRPCINLAVEFASFPRLIFPNAITKWVFPKLISSAMQSRENKIIFTHQCTIFSSPSATISRSIQILSVTAWYHLSYWTANFSWYHQKLSPYPEQTTRPSETLHDFL